MTHYEPPTLFEPLLDPRVRTLVRGVCLDLAVLACLPRGLATTLRAEDAAHAGAVRRL